MDSANQLVALRVQPRSRSDRVQGMRGEAFAIALKAPPVDGAANAALLRFLSSQLGLPLVDIALVRVRGWSAEQVKAALLA